MVCPLFFARGMCFVLCDHGGILLELVFCCTCEQDEFVQYYRMKYNCCTAISTIEYAVNTAVALLSDGFVTNTPFILYQKLSLYALAYNNIYLTLTRCSVTDTCHAAGRIF